MSGRINEMGYHPATVEEMEKCTGCTLCALVCPDMVIEVEREGKAV
jgi:2-oxoglutarate ferredoxin oxidoreductase subunit delta